jgi:RNA polymerase sigma-70 factor (ECF subfamily)
MDSDPLLEAPSSPSDAPGAGAEVLKQLRERIVAFAASRYARESAEDLAQEVLVVIHEKYGHLERLEDLVPLSLQILRFKLAAQQRKAFRRGEYAQLSVDELPLHGDAPDPEAVLARKEMLERLSAGIRLLGQRCQELFRFKLQGRSFPEIRELMGVEAINTVYTWDHRCRKQLLEWMGGRWER